MMWLIERCQMSLQFQKRLISLVPTMIPIQNSSNSHHLAISSLADVHTHTTNVHIRYRFEYFHDVKTWWHHLPLPFYTAIPRFLVHQCIIYNSFDIDTFFFNFRDIKICTACKKDTSSKEESYWMMETLCWQLQVEQRPQNLKRITGVDFTSKRIYNW